MHRSSSWKKAITSFSSATRWPSGCSISATGRRCSTAGSRNWNWWCAIWVIRPTRLRCGRARKNFKDHGDTLEGLKADVVLAFFGFDESFGGQKGLPEFEKELERFITETTSTNYNGKNPPRLVLISPIANENLHQRGVPDGKANNENIKLYTEAMAKVAKSHSIPFVDLYTPTKRHDGRIIFVAPDIQRHSPERPRRQAGLRGSRRRLVWPPAGRSELGPVGKSAGGSQREEPAVLLRSSRGQRLLHLWRSQKAVRRRQFSRRIRQAAEDDRQPRSPNLGRGPGKSGAGDDRRQQHRRIAESRNQLQKPDHHFHAGGRG